LIDPAKRVVDDAGNGEVYGPMTEQWLTYRQAGDMLHMTPEAVRQRARRLRWPNKLGNDGKALILVPPETIENATVQDAGLRPDKQADAPAPVLALDALQAHLDRVQQAAEAERQQFLVERGRLLDDLHAARVERARLLDALDDERRTQRDHDEAQAARHAADVGWHREEIDRLQRRLDAVEARSWWVRLFGRG
jgi:hypothetical protein